MNPAIYFLSSQAKKTYIPTPITIGEQVWDQKNLDTAYYSDGTPIPNNISTWGTTTFGAWRHYGDNSANGVIYGKLYNYYAVTGAYATGVTKSLAPAGWRVSKVADFDALVAYLQTTAPAMSTGTNKLRETGTTYWATGNTGTNTSSFSARGGGSITSGGVSQYQGSYGYFRTQTATSVKRITYNTNTTLLASTNANYGFSIRLIKEDINPFGFNTTPMTLQTLNGFTTGGYFSGFDTTTYANITDKGIVYGLTENPTITSNTPVSAGASLTVASNYAITLNGLLSNKTYYVRAYIINNGIKYYALQQACATGTGTASITTNDITNIDYTSATSGGTIDYDGGATITARGICYAVWPTTPTIGGAGSFDIPDSTGGTDSFTINMTNLTLGTKYLVSAYATNSVKTTYASSIEFSTRNTTITLSTTLAGDMYFETPTSLVGGGTITNTNDTAITAKGICWSSTNNTPTINDSYAPGDTSFTIDQPFYITASNLYPATQYYVRAYAANEGGTYYGGNTSIVTTFTPAVSLTTATVSDINAEYFACGAIAIDTGGYSVEAGYCWGATPNPTKGLNNFSSNPITTGPFTTSSSNNNNYLTPSTPYYVRAYMIIPSLSNYIVYASNSVGPYQTLSAIPTITTAAVTSFTATAITSGASAIITNGVNVTAKGICWSTSPVPIKATGNFSSAGTGSSPFTIATTNNLTYDKKYYIRAYVENAYAPYIHYGTEISQKTATPQNFITTGTASSWDAISVKCSATSITSDGSYPITETGYCWGITNIPERITTPKNYVKNPTETTFTNLASGALLSPSVSYYIRAYAINDTTGYIAYGLATAVFTTLTATPTFATTTSSNVKANEMTISSNVTATNGVPILVRGVVWSTSSSPTTALLTKTSEGTSSGTLTSLVTSLSGKVQYYVRAYVINAHGTYYSNEVIQTTATPDMLISTSAVTDVLAISATCGGYNIREDSLYPITRRGYTWGNAQDVPFPQPGAYPYVESTTNTGTSPFTISTGNQLSPLTTYNFRAYIYSVSANYYAYGPVIQASQTLSATPTVTTSAVTSYDVQNITAGGSVTLTKGVPVTDKGLCYAVSPIIPTKVAGKFVSAGAGEGAFSLTINGLTHGTTYNILAYSVNEYGALTYYATNPISQQTAIPNFSIVTGTVTNLKPLSATIAATVIQGETNPTYQITSRGVCWGTAPNPTKITTAGSQNYAEPADTGTFSEISSDFSNYKLTPGIQHYFKAYATNLTTGYIAYGSDVIVTIPLDNATATLVNSVANVTTTSFDITTYTINEGSFYTPSERGIVYGVSNPPTIGNGNKILGTVGTVGPVGPVSITGLSPNTTYHVRSFVTNAVKTTYSALVLSKATNFATTLKNAYALRRIVEGYNGPCILLRNAAGATRDIGFDANGDIDKAAIEAFTGTTATSQGTVNTWYDQNGANNLNVYVPNSRPCWILRNGVYQTRTIGVVTRPCIRWIQSGAVMLSTVGSWQVNNLSIFMVTSTIGYGSTQYGLLMGSMIMPFPNTITANTDRLKYGATTSTIATGQTDIPKLDSTLSTTTGIKVWRNNTLVNTFAGTDTAIDTQLYFGSNFGTGGNQYNGTIQELRIYAGNVDSSTAYTTTRETISTAIKQYYNIT